MTLEDGLKNGSKDEYINKNKDLIDFFKSLSMKEKVYFCGAQLGACSLTISLIGTMINPDAWLPVDIGSALLMYGSIFAFKKAYNARNPHDPAKIDWRPGVHFGDKRYTL